MLPGNPRFKYSATLLVCTELYLKKIRQQVDEDEAQGVCWEANIIYSLLYERKLNTTKFSPVLFSPADRRFIPPILKGRDCFMVDFQSGYNRLYAFLTDQHRIHFPETVQPSFAPPGEAAEPARTDSVPTPEPIPAATPQLTLLRELALAPDDDLAAEASDEMTGVAFVIPIKPSDVLTGSGFGRTALYAGVAKAKERTEPRS